VQDRKLLEVGGVWIDEGYCEKTPTVAVKAQSDAYFRILERHPEVKGRERDIQITRGRWRLPYIVDPENWTTS